MPATRPQLVNVSVLTLTLIMVDIRVSNAAPKVSVLTITYNHEKFIAQAIESVLMQQTDFPFELVIGEDCSTDGTREIVREYSQKYPGIIRAYLREHNLGSHENSHQVFLASKGKYIAVLEGDDYWTSPRKLQIQADLLDAHPETVLCGHRVVWHYEGGSRADTVLPADPEGVYDLERFFKKTFLAAGSVMFRRSDYRVPEWHRGLLMGDIPLFAELGRHGKFYLLNDTMGTYRIHGGGIWSGLDDLNQAKQIRTLYRAFYEHLDPKYRPAIVRRLFWCSYDVGVASSTAGMPDEVRVCLRECLRYSGPLKHLPEKFWLAFKGYCWWTFPVLRRLRRFAEPAGSSSRRWERVIGNLASKNRR